MRLLPLMLLVSTAALAEPGIMLLPALGTPKGITLSGRVLKEVPTKGSSTLSKNLRRLAASGWDGAPIEGHGAALPLHQEGVGAPAQLRVGERLADSVRPANQRVPLQERLSFSRAVSARARALDAVGLQAAGDSGADEGHSQRRRLLRRLR